MTATSDTKLVLTLVSDLEVVGTRVFNAPRELVFRAYIDPALIPRWWGYATLVETQDTRVGGRWRYLHRPHDQEEIAFSGEYREITPPSRVVRTSNFEPVGPGHEVLETVEFEELEGARTRMTSSMRFLSKEDRDAMIESGMEGGYSQSLERLQEILEELAASA